MWRHSFHDKMCMSLTFASTSLLAILLCRFIILKIIIYSSSKSQQYLSIKDFLYLEIMDIKLSMQIEAPMKNLSIQFSRLQTIFLTFYVN